jgi:hypothetical protein
MNGIRNRNAFDFVRTLAILSTVLLAAHPAAAATQTAAKSKVVTVHNPRAIDNRNQCDPAEVRAMLDQGLQALTGKTSAREAWMALGLTPEDVVGIKINCNNWTIKLSPHPELVAVLMESLGSIVPLNNIIFYDMTKSDLEDDGFKRNASTQGVRFLANDADAGVDDQERLAQIVTSMCTKLINLASLKSVDTTVGNKTLAVSVFFKNHVGSLTVKDAPKSHGDFDFMAGILARPSIRKKTILNLCDGLRGTYKRGVPWYWGGIILGLDPVASEYVSVRVINEKRIQEKEKPFETPPYLEIAEKKYGLGTCQPANIDWVRLER